MKAKNVGLNIDQIKYKMGKKKQQNNPIILLTAPLLSLVSFCLPHFSDESNVTHDILRSNRKKYNSGCVLGL